jgi:hypothetical protein
VQAFKSLFEFFEKVTCIILAVMVDYNYFMCAGIGLGKRTWKVFRQVCGFIPGTDNYTNRMLLRIIL